MAHSMKWQGRAGRRAARPAHDSSGLVCGRPSVSLRDVVVGCREVRCVYALKESAATQASRPPPHYTPLLIEG